MNKTVNPHIAPVRQLLEQATTLLPSDTARLDAEVLLAHVLGKARSHLHAWPEKVLSAEQQARFRQLLQARLRGEPVAYLTGQREFWSLPLSVTPATLIPRPETETLVALALQVIPRQLRDGGAASELLAVGGVVIALVAIALTGGIDSAYTLFLTVPVFYASAFSGFRLGVTTALLAITGLAVVAGSLGQEILQPGLVQTAALLVLLAIAFAQARYILVEERQRTSELERTSLLNATKLERLSTAHTLLVSLSDLADSSELNPVTIGQAALRDLARVVPFEAGTVAITDPDDDGDITVARRGVPGSARPVEYRISLGDRTTGTLTLWPSANGDLDQREDLVHEALRPVALAFDNIQLIREIAGRAVHEERVRVARELHDEIAPALASLGLGIDMAIHQHEMNPELARHLETLRQRLAGSIETATAFSPTERRISSMPSPPTANSAAGLSAPIASSATGCRCPLINSRVFSDRGPVSIASMICRIVTISRVTRWHHTPATSFCRLRNRP